MRIFYAITKSELGGAQTHVLHLMKGMRERGHTVALMCAPGGWLDAQARLLGVTVYENPYFKNTYNPLRIIDMMRSIRSAVREFRPDVVALHSSLAGIAGRLAIRNKIPTVFTAHSFAFTDGAPFIRKVVAIIAEWVVAHFVSNIICVSEYDASLARRYHIAPARTLVRIYNGVVVDPEIPVRQDHEKIRIVFVGRLAYPKHTAMVVNAFASLPESLRAQAQLTFIGDGPDRSALEEVISIRGVGSSVRIEGTLPPPEVYKQLRAADIFILLSKHEGFPMTILEAMAAGLPVIASGVGGIPEAINQECGIVVPNDVVSVTAALTRLITDHALRKSMGHAAYDRVHAQFSVERCIEETAALYALVVRK